MRRTALILMFVLAAVAVVVHAQPRQGVWSRFPDRPSAGTGVRAHTDWVLLCFELQLPLDQLGQLRSAFQQAYDDQRQLVESMSSGELEREEMAESLETIQENLQAAYEEHLTEEQRTELKEARAGMLPAGGVGPGGMAPGRPRRGWR